MATRLELESLLRSLLGSDNVYYQSPSQNNMEYPAIRYSKTKPSTAHADNKTYIKKPCYQIIVMDKKPDNPVIEKLLELPYCSWNNHYVANNLNHDVLTLYY